MNCYGIASGGLRLLADAVLTIIYFPIFSSSVLSPNLSGKILVVMYVDDHFGSLQHWVVVLSWVG